MAILTVHHWDDAAAGLAELRRVAPRVLVLAIDFEVHSHFWLLDEYLPEVGDFVRRNRPDVAEIATAIGASVTIPLRVSRDHQDGVMGAYWCRPERYLDPGVRANASGLALAEPATLARGISRLASDLSSGAWQDRHADLPELDDIDVGYRLLVGGEGR